jgi:hypothetical protein
VESERRYFNPIDWLAARGVDCSHITFDPTVTPEYRIIRGSTHDGTFMFTDELYGRALGPLANRSSFYKGTEPDWSKVESVRYTVGLARHATVYGKVMLPCSTTQPYPGQRERLTIPVRCEYVLRG